MRRAFVCDPDRARSIDRRQAADEPIEASRERSIRLAITRGPRSDLVHFACGGDRASTHTRRKKKMGRNSPTVREAAELEAGRKIDYDEGHSSRVGQYKYDAVDALSAGRGRGVFATCPIRRERSATVELRDLLAYEREINLRPVKGSARGLVFLMEDEDASDGLINAADPTNPRNLPGDAADVELLRRVDRLLYGNGDGTKFCIKVFPVFHSVRLHDAHAGDAGERTVDGDERLCQELVRIGADLEAVVGRSESMFRGPSTGVQETGGHISIAVKFSGRKLLDDDLKQRYITALCRGFAGSRKPKQVSVSLQSPDVVVIVEALDVMGRTFLMVGLAPARWLTRGKLQLRALNGAARKASGGDRKRAADGLAGAAGAAGAAVGAETGPTRKKLMTTVNSTL